MNGMVDFGMASAMCPEVLRDAMLRSFSMMMEVMIPARVIEYNRDTHRVLVEPLVKNFDRNSYQDCPPYNCTVWRMYCGRYLIDFPIEVGDTGWILSADRDPTTVKSQCFIGDKESESKKKLVQYAPDTDRVHSFEFGMFIPDRWGDKYNTDKEHNAQLTGSAEDAKRLVIQSADGNQKVSIRHFDSSDKGEIKITSIDTSDASNKTIITIKNGVVTVENSKKVNVTSPEVDVTASKSIDVHCPKVTYDQSTAFKIDGTLLVTGDITSEADIIPSSGFTLNKHKHTGDGGPAVGPTSKPDGNIG